MLVKCSRKPFFRPCPPAPCNSSHLPDWLYIWSGGRLVLTMVGYPEYQYLATLSPKVISILPTCSLKGNKFFLCWKKNKKQKSNWSFSYKPHLFSKRRKWYSQCIGHQLNCITNVAACNFNREMPRCVLALACRPWTWAEMQIGRQRAIWTV